MITYKEAIELIFRGKAIFRRFEVEANEILFREEIEAVTLKKAGLNPFKKKGKNFIGEFSGTSSREFKFKVIPDYLNSASMEKMVKVNGKLIPLKDDLMEVEISYAESKSSKFFRYLFSFFIIFALLFGDQSISERVMMFLAYGFALALATLYFTEKLKRLISYFEESFFSGFKYQSLEGKTNDTDFLTRY